MAGKVIKINRAPVMTLWATVVAERLGYDPDAALSLGKAVAGLNAQSKGRSLGIYRASGEGGGEGEPAGPEPDFVSLLGRPVLTVETEDGIRASIRGEVVEPQPVQTYLIKKFGADLDEVRKAMQALAESFDPEALESQSFQLYEQFRPAVPKGKRGWGATGELDLTQLQRLAKRQS